MHTPDGILVISLADDVVFTNSAMFKILEADEGDDLREKLD